MYYANRIVAYSGSTTTTSNNYAYTDMTVETQAGISTPTSDANGKDGSSQTLATIQGANGNWWTGTTVGWTTSINWGGSGETRPWKWDSVNLRPIMWFETAVNQ